MKWGGPFVLSETALLHTILGYTGLICYDIGLFSSFFFLNVYFQCFVCCLEAFSKLTA